jgi:hypothetical protein
MKARIALPTAALLALVGCTLTQTQLRDGNTPTRIGGGPGRLIAPKRCALQVFLVTRPAGDPIVNDDVWREADAQVLGDDARRALEANGLRVGRITGELPVAVRALMDAPGADKVVPITLIRMSGDSTLIDLGPPRPQTHILLNRGDGVVVGKVYDQAKPHLRLTATFDDADGIALRIVPELHHGPVRQGWGPAPVGAFEERQFVPRTGQEEDTFRDLAATLPLKPGQIAVIGARGGKAGGRLGDLLFNEPAETGDRGLQKILLITAARSSPPALEPVEP